MKFKLLLSISTLFISGFLSAQCPSNLSFDAGNLSFWSHYPGTYPGTNGTFYPTSGYTVFNAPPAKITTSVSRLGRDNNTGVEVIKANADGTNIADAVQSTISKVPTINGYKYDYAIKLGNSNTGAYADKVTYFIDVPANITTYNITYAYALLLQDPGHIASQQPKFRASVIDASTDTKINCASKEYYAGDGQTYGTSSSGTKYIDWQEVSFDLSQYAGKKIELRFEMFDCSQGGHYGYGYIALRNDGCGTGVISGNSIVCSSNSSLTYSTASVAGANYTWTLPVGWTGSSTSSSITVNPNGNPGGNITVTPSQSCGNITTRSVAVTTVNSVPETPGLIQGNSTVCSGSSNLTYSVDPVNNASSYVWTYPAGWTIVSGLNTNSITFNANSTSGNITVKSKNLCGNSSVSTSAVSITNDALSLAGSISGVPGSIQCPEYFTANSVNLSLGTSTGSIQKWLSSTDGGISWTNINNTTSTLNIAPTRSTLYKAVVKNGSVCVEDESSQVLVDVYSQIQILNQPSSVNTCASQNKTFSVSAIGDGTLSYNWQVSSDNGTTWTNISSAPTNYSGYATSTLTVSSGNVTLANNGLKYKCIISSSVNCSPVTSNIATLSVSSSSIPVINTQPSNQTFCTGSVANISLTASGPSLSYQWQSSTDNINFSNIAGETNTNLSISTTSANTKFYKCIITEACGSLTTTSNTAQIEIATSSTVSATISSSTGAICAGTNKTFTASALNEGTSPVYTWYKNGSAIPGQTGVTYSTTDLSSGDAIYATVTSNKACAIGSPASSNTISTIVNSLSSINNTTGSSSVNVGSSILLANSTSNGTWSSSAPGIASVNSGTVTGISEGNVNILYSVTDNQTPACTNTATKSITVYAQSPSGLSYTTPNVYTRGTAITALNPTISGGAVTGYTITPILPTGLVINSGTGIISGTPTVNSAATNYTVTATNSGGSVTAVVNITVNDIAPSGLSYTTPNVYTRGTAITALNPTISGGAVTGYTITPALPTGLVINSVTGIISGTPTVNSAATNYTVTASNSGGSVSAVVNITVKLDQPQGSLSSVDYLLLKSDTVSLKLNVSDGTSPFSVILTNDQNNSKDTIANLVDGAILKLKPISKTTIFKLFKLIDANQSERASGFSKDTSIIRIAIPNLAMTLKAESPVKLPDNSFRTKLLLKLKNAGELGLKNVQVNANLNQVFPTYLNYVLDSIKLVSGNVKLNSNYTGKGTSTSTSNSKSNYQSSSIKSNTSLDPNYLFDNGVNLAVSDEAEVQYFMSISATPNNITLKLQFQSEAQAVITKNDGTTSQEVSKALSDNGMNLTSHPNITNIGVPLPTILPLYPVEKIGASLSVSNATPVAGGYTFDFVVKVKNYSNLNLDTVALINELSKTFTSSDTAYIINTPVVTGGFKFNTSFNGYSNTLLIDSTAKLAVGDSATIAYTLKVITDKINYTWLNSVIASGHSTLDYDYINDISVEGNNPDPNGDNDPLEQTETRFSVSYIRPLPPTVENKTYTYGNYIPPSISGLVKSYPIGTIPVWCDVATAICNQISPKTPLAIGKYVYYLKSYDTTTKLYSIAYVNDTVIIRPPLPIVNDSTYIIGQTNNPANVSVQVKAMTGGVLKYFYKANLVNTIPVLGTTPGTTSYTVSQVVNQIESDTASFKVTMLLPNDILHLQKIAGDAQLQSNSSFIIPFTFIARNVLNKQLDSVLITDNLLNAVASPNTFNIVSLSSTGGLIANTNFNGKTDINLTQNASKLSASAIDTIKLVINVMPNGYSGALQNTAIANAKTPYGKLSINSTSRAYTANETTKYPTTFTIPDLRIDIPEGFSPNRDGVNDYFVIIKPYGTILDLEVYNRWGNIVYSNPNYNNEWDGRGTNNFIGQELMDGGYYYSLKAKLANGTVQIFKGFVLIQR